MEVSDNESPSIRMPLPVAAAVSINGTDGEIRSYTSAADIVVLGTGVAVGVGSGVGVAVGVVAGVGSGIGVAVGVVAGVG